MDLSSLETACLQAQTDVMEGLKVRTYAKDQLGFRDAQTGSTLAPEYLVREVGGNGKQLLFLNNFISPKLPGTYLVSASSAVIDEINLDLVKGRVPDLASALGAITFSAIGATSAHTYLSTIEPSGPLLLLGVLAGAVAGGTAGYFAVKELQHLVGHNDPESQQSTPSTPQEVLEKYQHQTLYDRQPYSFQILKTLIPSKAL